MGNKTYHEVLKWASSFLEEQQMEQSAALYLMLERLNWGTTEWVMHLHEPMPLAERTQFETDLKAFVEGRPAQYIIGSCAFYGLRLEVTEATLIPRPETEELVALCLASLPAEPLRIVDVGTGTGAIALALKQERPMWQVTALDISEEALAVAQRNAEKLGLDVEFIHSDLTASLLAAGRTVDAVISNPPYIGKSEIAEMDERVLRYEPTLALFAENEGFALYERLFEELPQLMPRGGNGFFEMGYRQGAGLKQRIARALPQARVEVVKDLQGLERMVQIQWKT